VRPRVAVERMMIYKSRISGTLGWRNGPKCGPGKFDLVVRQFTPGAQVKRPVPGLRKGGWDKGPVSPRRLLLQGPCPKAGIGGVAGLPRATCGHFDEATWRSKTDLSGR